MIEFIIPLNLPIRAVEITETTAGPPASLVHVHANWVPLAPSEAARPHESQSPNHAAARSETAVEELPDAREMARERESLRAQQTLFAEAVRELRQATKTAQQQLQGIVAEFQEATVELAQTIAAKLIFEEVSSNRFPVANLVHEVISRLDTHANAVVRLHPDDLAIIQEYSAIDGSDNERPIQFVADKSLSRGDCKAKAGEISVIYELRRQIEEIRRQLLSTVSGHAET